MNGRSARLVVQQGPSPQQTFLLSGPQMQIGRSADNDIVINDAEVSRRHAQILLQSGEYVDRYLIEDLGSTNGTFVNGARCTGLTPLAHSDVIELGETIRLVFLEGDDDETFDESEYDTADLEPLPPGPPLRSPAAPSAAASPRWVEDSQEISPPAGWSNSQRLAVGCGCALLLLLCLCGATFFFLDWYQEGQLLYCGGLRPFFEIVLGPFGFSPICP